MTALSDLTEAQVKALDWLPVARTWADVPRKLQGQLDALARRGLINIAAFFPADGSVRWSARLTPPGLALKRERMAQGGKS